MAISEARRHANDKWREKFDEVRFRVPLGKKKAIQEFAAANGESVNAFLNRIIEKAMTQSK